MQLRLCPVFALPPPISREIFPHRLIKPPGVSPSINILLPQYMDAAPHLGSTADLEMRTARVADPALGTCILTCLFH